MGDDTHVALSCSLSDGAHLPTSPVDAYYCSTVSSPIGGLTVRHDGAPGAILARGLLSDAAIGYSASLESLDPGTAKSARYHKAGLRLADVGGTPVAPAVVAYNAGMTAAMLTGRLRIATPNGRPMAFEFPQTRLEPGAARRIDLFDVWTRARFFSDAPAGIEFDYSVTPGSVVLAATSVSSDLEHAIRVPLTDPLSPPSATGGYPWRVTATGGTVVYLKNTTNDPHDYVLQLSYPGGSYSLGVRTLDTVDGHHVQTTHISYGCSNVLVSP